MSDISQININNTTYNFKDAEGRTQVKIMPAASADLLGKIYQFIGATGTYTNGYFYKCVLGSTAGTYEWIPVSVQEGGGSSVQSDWNQTDSIADDYIKNKPDLFNVIEQVWTMPEPSEEYQWKTYLYMGQPGASGFEYAHLYRCMKYSSSPSVYAWSDVTGSNWIQPDWNQTDGVKPDYIKNKPTLGTASAKDVATSGDASATQVVMGNDSRLNNSISSTSATSPITDSAAGYVQGITIYGRSEVVDGEIKSVGDDGLTVTTANSDNTLTISAEFTTALPLRGVSDTVRDVMEWDGSAGTVTKNCAEIDLGTLDFVIPTGYTNVFVANVPTAKNINGKTYNALCSKYACDTTEIWYSIPDKEFCIGNNIRQANVPAISIKDTDYNDAETFKTAMTGVKLVYELATPTVTPLTDAEISAFRALRTFDGTTNITISDEPDFELDYLKNTANGQAVADIQRDLQGQIDEVKNATKPRVYAFYVDQNDSNPATCVHPYYNTKYGCDNLFYQNAYMDYEKDEFNYGSWEDFIKEFFKPCMLAYDGHVDYYLDPDDYSKKLDGGDSDISDMTYNGNVMVQIKTLYFKRWTTGGKYYCIISDKKLDKSFKAFAHHDIKGNVVDYIYRAAYDGSYDGTRLRSISGIDYHNLNALTVNKIMSNTTRQQEIDFAKANNDANEQGEGWNILHKAEWDLINDLLLLIGMSTNTQATFGNGNISSYVSASNTGIIATGTMDKKGLFYGKNDNVSGAKVFGFEHPWGNIWKSCLGWILSANQHLVKMTPGNEDGSTATDYNFDGTGYVATGKSITANGYISAFDGADTGFLSTAASGSATTYMCDYVWQNTATYFALVGGSSSHGAPCGAFYANLSDSAAIVSWAFGAALSYKPLARG